MSLDSYEKCWGENRNNQPYTKASLYWLFQEKKNIPFPSQSFQISLHLREPQHTPWSIPQASPNPQMKGIPS